MLKFSGFSCTAEVAFENNHDPTNIQKLLRIKTLQSNRALCVGISSLTNMGRGTNEENINSSICTVDSRHVV
jgi:hypothetical protein